MKTLNIRSVSKNVIGTIALFLSVQLSTAQAQTFIGENGLKEDPISLPALIYPTNKPQTVRVNAHNRYGGPLTIVIRDSKGNTKHTEVTFASKYIGRFNLSPLGAGTYTFELSNQAGQTYTRTFLVETPAPRVIALGDSIEKPFDQEEKFGSIDH
jgi:hypothetical protein